MTWKTGAAGVLVVLLIIATQGSPLAGGVHLAQAQLARQAVYCSISSNGSANARSAPDLSADIVARITRSVSVDVLGRSEDNQWYAIQLPTGIGWIARSVAREVTPCENVPVYGSVTPTPQPTSTPTAAPSATPVILQPSLPTPSGTFAPTEAPTEEVTADLTDEAATPEATLPAIAPDDQDYSIGLIADTVTHFSELVSFPAGDYEDRIAVQARLSGADTKDRAYRVILECRGEGIDLLRWGIDTERPDLSCGSSRSISFSQDVSQHEFVIRLTQGPALVGYTLTFSPQT